MLVLFVLLDSSSSNVLIVILAGEAEVKQANTCFLTFCVTCFIEQACSLKSQGLQCRTAVVLNALAL